MSDFNVPGSRPKKHDEISEIDRTYELGRTRKLPRRFYLSLSLWETSNICEQTTIMNKHCPRPQNDQNITTAWPYTTSAAWSRRRRILNAPKSTKSLTVAWSRILHQQPILHQQYTTYYISSLKPQTPKPRSTQEHQTPNSSVSYYAIIL